MKKRIWNQLKKAVMITAAVGTLGAGAVSAAEFGSERSERTVQKSTGEYCFGERTVADGK